MHKRKEASKMLDIKITGQNNSQVSFNSTGIMIQSVEGLDPVKANINLGHLTSNIGQNYLSYTLPERNIVITAFIYRSPDQIRNKIFSAFTTGEKVNIEINGKIIDGIVESIETARFKIGQTIQISIICPYPFFRAKEAQTIMASNVDPRFKFPFYCNNGETFVFGELKDNITLTVVNEGRAVGGIFTLQATGQVVNPVITDLKTGDTMGIKDTMAEGEKIIINTRLGEKSIYHYTEDEARSKILKKISPDFEWAQIGAGDTLFKVEAEQGISNLQVELSYYPEYSEV